MRSDHLVGESFLEELMVERSLEGRVGSGGGTERVVLAERTACTRPVPQNCMSHSGLQVGECSCTAGFVVV